MADGYLNFDTKINEKGFNEGVSKLGNLGKSGLKIGAGALTGVATAAGTGIAAAVKVGATFEAEMSKVSAISGATGSDLEALTSKAKEMGAKTKFSATESAQAMEYMAMAGWKTTDMLNGIEGIMNLAAASGEDLATTSDIVTDALTAFGLSAADSTRFADILARASSNANTNVGLMGETFKYVAPVAGALGFSAEDCATAIGLMANSGIKASQAGTSLRSIFTRMAKPTKEVRTAMDQLGVSLTDESGNMKSLHTIMTDLRSGFSGLTQDQKAQMAAALGGQEAMSGLLAIVNASDADFNNLTNSIANCNGAAADMAATMMDNLAGQITIFKSGLESLGISIYESLEKPMKEAVAAAVDVLSDLNAAYASNGFAGFVREIGDKVPMIQSFTNAIADLAARMKYMSSDELMNLGKMAILLAGAVPGIIGFGKGINVIETAVGGFNGIIDGVAGSITGLPGKVKGAASAVNSAGGMFKTFGNSLMTPFEGLGDKVGGALGKVTYRVGYYGEGIKNQLSNLAAPVSSSISKFTAPLKNVGSAVAQSLGNVGTKISGYAGIIGNAFKPILAKAVSFVPAFLKCMNLVGGVGIVLVGMGLLYNAFGGQIDQIIAMMVTKGPSVVRSFCNGITTAIPELIAKGMELNLNLMSAIEANLPAVITGGIQIVTALIEGVAAQLPALIPAAVSMVITLVTSILGNIGQIINAGMSLLKGLAQGVMNALPVLISKAPTIIGNLASTIISNLPKILATGVQILVILAKGLVSAIPQLIGQIPAIISQIKNAFTSIDWGSVGKHIVSGIANGLSGAAGSIVSAAKSAAKKALDTAKNFLGIHSPSRVFRDQVGKMMALGMGVGFEKNIPIKSMSAGVQKAVSGLQNSVDVAMSAKANDPSVGKTKNWPGFDGGEAIDYDRLERIQMRAADKMAKRPVYLGTKRIDEPLPKGAVPAL